MAQVIIKSHQDFEEYLGKELGVSDYLEITQEQVNQFADATIDHQWIHTDPEKAKIDSPFKATIAHGYLTVSLLKYFWDDVVEVQNIKAVINYGIDKFKFGEAVLVGSKVRVRIWLNDLADLRGITRLQLMVRMEIEDKKKPAYEGLITFLYHFK
ncbi:MAG: acyl dehydratase [Marinilabiliales bacterium]|nr:MAG: acyl dehydratase [Marinilabiliales bacterium]